MQASLSGYDSGVPKRGTLPFDAKGVGEEIERIRVRLGIPLDEGANPLWKRIGLSNRTHWYAKTDGTRPFRWEEAARVAVEFQAPRGWPIIPWDEGLAWEAWLRNGQ